MTSDELSKAYLKKAKVRVKVLKTYHDEKDYSDVVREAQECIELLLKALLRHVGQEVPKVHDVGRALDSCRKNLPEIILSHLDEIKKISRELRKDRELAFYGTEDWIPTEEYTETHSLEAITMAQKIYEWVSKALKE